MKNRLKTALGLALILTVLPMAVNAEGVKRPVKNVKSKPPIEQARVVAPTEVTTPPAEPVATERGIKECYVCGGGARREKATDAPEATGDNPAQR